MVDTCHIYDLGDNCELSLLFAGDGTAAFFFDHGDLVFFVKSKSRKRLSKILLNGISKCSAEHQQKLRMWLDRPAIDPSTFHSDFPIESITWVDFGGDAGSVDGMKVLALA